MNTTVLMVTKVPVLLLKKGIKNPCVKAVCKWLESEATEDGKCEKI